MRTILVTGAAGFIGFHLTKHLLAQGDRVVGVDSVNDYYDVSLKEARLGQLVPHPAFSFIKGDISVKDVVETVFRRHPFDIVVNLAAQAGVRYSLKNPHAYLDSNLSGFLNILEGCRHAKVPHLVYASSSSVYGANTKMPFSVHDNVDHPVSLYAASKKANELMAHAYSHVFRLPATGLRFFTVYGPWGRPDMALFLFTKAILAGQPIDVFNNGQMQRDFTYIDDIVDGIVRTMTRPPEPDAAWRSDQPDPSSSLAPWKVYNIGNNHPVPLLYMIEVLERCLGRKAVKNMLALQPGDLPASNADIGDIMRDHGYRPKTTIEEGIERFVEWYKGYYRA